MNAPQAILNKNKLSSSALFQTMLPLMNLHRTLSNATAQNHKLSATGVVASKKSMLEKLTKLVTTRLAKVKVGGEAEGAEDCFKALVEEAKRSPSRDHCACVSLCMISCLKACPSGVEGGKDAYAELMEVR